MSNRFPAIDEYFHLGRILKSHGTDGRLRVQVEARHLAYLKKGGFVFIDIDGSKVPYAVAGFEKGANYVLALADVNDKGQSDAFTGSDLFIPLDQVQSKHLKLTKGKSDPLSGFTIVDQRSGKSFSILRVEEFPQQEMAIVMVEDREVMIPLHDDLIVEVLEEKRTILMELPDGLLDL